MQIGGLLAPVMISHQHHPGLPFHQNISDI